MLHGDVSNVRRFGQGIVQAENVLAVQTERQVDAVRAEFAGPTREPEREQARDVFDLLVAVRGLRSAGNSDWGQAEQLCRALKWPRCDRPALEELKASSRP